jgi:putative Mn2+ efflux pump MntP
MDAFAVSIGKGLSVRKIQFKHSLSVGLWFGGFQALMPIIGYFLGVSFSSLVASVDHWIAFLLLALIGMNMIRESCSREKVTPDPDFSARAMFLMAVATSIDALAVGITMAFLNVNIWVVSTTIGVVTLLLSALGVMLGCKFGEQLGNKAGILGGLILIGLGIKILLEHLGVISF